MKTLTQLTAAFALMMTIGNPAQASMTTSSLVGLGKLSVYSGQISNQDLKHNLDVYRQLAERFVSEVDSLKEFHSPSHAQVQQELLGLIQDAQARYMAQVKASSVGDYLSRVEPVLGAMTHEFTELEAYVKKGAFWTAKQRAKQHLATIAEIQRRF